MAIPSGYEKIKANTLYENVEYYIDTSVAPTQITSNISYTDNLLPFLNVGATLGSTISYWLCISPNTSSSYNRRISTNGFTSWQNIVDGKYYMEVGSTIETFDTLNINLTTSPDWLYVKTAPDYSKVKTIEVTAEDGTKLSFNVGGGGVEGGNTVSFVSNGTDYASFAVVSGNAINAPSAPIVSGYTFKGWYTAETDGTRVAFPYTPTADTTLYAQFAEGETIGFTGLSQSSGALTWTGAIAGFDTWSKSTSGNIVTVTSPLDDVFPFNKIEEFTDSSGNVMVKFPQMYIRFIYNGSAIDGFDVSGANDGGDMFIPDCYLNPADNGATYLDYFALGKYEGSGSTSMLYSKSGADCLVNITRANARSSARAYGSSSNYYNGYQIEDFSMFTLYNFLCMLYYKTANIQTVYGGRTGKGSVSSWSGASVTGTCDGVSGLNGWNTGTDCVKMLGIENPYGNISKWVDGVWFSSQTIYAQRLPQNFNDGTSNSVTLGFSRPSTSDGFISSLRAGVNAGTQSYVYANGVEGTESTFVGDRYFYSSSGTVLYVGGSWAFGSDAGLWCLAGDSTASSSYASIGARLSYRPL